MNKGKQFQQSMQKFEHSMHNWNNIDIGLALLAIGFLLLTVGEMLRVHFNLIAGTVTCVEYFSSILQLPFLRLF